MRLRSESLQLRLLSAHSWVIGPCRVGERAENYRARGWPAEIEGEDEMDAPEIGLEGLIPRLQ